MNALLRNQNFISGFINYNRPANYVGSAIRRTVHSRVYKLRDCASLLSYPHYPLSRCTFQRTILPSSSICLQHVPISINFQLSVGNGLGAASIRNISTSSKLYEQTSSKVEATVNKIKQDIEDQEKEKDKAKQLESTTTQAASNKSGTGTAAPASGPAVQISEKELVTTPPVVKKSLQAKIWAEIVHYYHGFRLLAIDVKISCKLLWKILNGEKLTRREHRLLIRTTSDLFRLVPFSVFIIVPFMELLLPVFIKFFPGMLPSTFQTAKDRDEKLKQNLKVKLEMAKFLQKTLDEMAVQHKDHRSEAAKQFSQFVIRTRNTGEPPNSDEIIKFSKLFEDEITLDSLTRQQLQAICRVLEVPTIGTNNFLQFQLRMKLRNLAADDRTIQKEGVDSLNLSELQAACRSRGMRAYGMTEDHLKNQLTEWINLSLNEKVPPSLLLLSRAMMLPEHIPTSDKLKATISALPETVVTQTKAAIGEREGKIDNRTKIEIIREEERKIKEEKEEEKAKKKDAEIMEDKAPVILESSIAADLDKTKVLDAAATAQSTEISSQDLEVLSDALGEISKDKKTLLVEKEEIKDLKEEIADYVEDVKELNEVAAQAQNIKESKAAKLLHKKVDDMIGKLDKVLTDLEKKEQKLKEDIHVVPDESDIAQKKKDELVNIDELLSAIRKLQKIDDDVRLQQIQKILSKLDDDSDGKLKVDDVLKVIETIARDNVNLNGKQFDELIQLMAKEELLDNEQKIQIALAKEMKAKQMAKLAVEKAIKAEQERLLPSELQPENKQKMSDNIIVDSVTMKEAVARQNEKILPPPPNLSDPSSIPPIPPPQLPTGADKPKNKTL